MEALQNLSLIGKLWVADNSTIIDKPRKRSHYTQHNDIKKRDIQHNDIQHNDIQHNDIQHNDTQHNSEHCYAECPVMLSVQSCWVSSRAECPVMLSVIYSEGHLWCAIYMRYLLSVVMLNAVLLNVVMLNVVAPRKHLRRRKRKEKFWQFLFWIFIFYFFSCRNSKRRIVVGSSAAQL